MFYLFIHKNSLIFSKKQTVARKVQKTNFTALNKFINSVDIIIINKNAINRVFRGNIIQDYKVFIILIILINCCFNFKIFVNSMN